MQLIRICVAALPLAVVNAAGADVVMEWNQVALDAVKATGTAPPPTARGLAMMHTAVFDAVNSISGGHRGYKFFEVVPSTTSKEAAAAQAARDVLASLFPSQIGAFDARLAMDLAAIADGPDKAAGIALGSTVAGKVIASRTGDGSSPAGGHVQGNQPGDWQPTPPAFNPNPAFQQYATTGCWAMSSPSQFRQGPPPALSSTEYRDAYNEVKEIGSLNSLTRTPEQTDIARLWAAGGGTVTPPGQWNKIAQVLGASQGNTLEENARMFALLNIATADAAVCSWDMKVHYDFWRPVTGIRAGDTDGNPDTAGDADWTPLLATPNFQAYTSGHSTFSGAASSVLAQFFGTDALSFSLTADDVPITRNFTSLSAAADEAGMSRIYGGIHWMFDNTAGLSSGRALGGHVFENFLAVPTPGAGAVMVLGVIALARRRRAS